MSAPPLSNHELDDDSAAPVDAQRRLELLEDCREIVVSRMSRAIAEALEKMSDELTALALKKTRREEQGVLLEAVSLVRQNRPEIELRFRRAFVDVFERRIYNRSVLGTAGLDPDSELTLVDDNEIEDRIALTRIVHRANSKLDPDEVLGVRARLAALVERDWFEEDKHPASPEAVFEALRTALDHLGPSVEIKAALLEAFEPYVSANLNRVYANVNETLKSNRVLTRIKPRAVVSRGAPKAAGSTGQAPGAPLPAGAGVAGARAAGTGDAVGAVTPHLLETFEDLLRQIQSGKGSARQAAARILADPQGFGVADLPLPAPEVPLVEALDSLQQFAAGEVKVSGHLLEDLMEQARDKGSALDQLTVEIVALVFDYIYADRHLPDLVKQQLLRLQVVAVKAALLDRSFFARRQHPMRRLIDRITEVATDPDSDVTPESPLMTGLREIGDRILAEFERDLGVFEDALQRVDLIAFAESERRATQLAELTRKVERVETLAVAEDAARADILARCDEQTPEFVRDFLAQWWAQAMAEIRTRPQAPASDWDEALALGEQLLWSTAPKTPDEIPRLAALLPRLIGGLMRGLQNTSIAREEREKFFNSLLQWHTRAITLAKENPPGGRVRQERALSLGADGKVRFDPTMNQHAAACEVPIGSVLDAMLDDAQRGDQVDLTLEDGTMARVKLAWISPSRKLFAVTRHPDIARSIERRELAQLFRSGKARWVDEVSAMDRAIDAVAEGATT